MWLFPHQQAEKSPQNQHVFSILQVGSHQLQYRFFRTNKPKSHHKTNTICPITQILLKVSDGYDLSQTGNYALSTHWLVILRIAPIQTSPGPNGPGDYRSGWRDLNPRPLRPERSALPSCATPRCRSSIASPCRYSQTETERAFEVWSTPHVVRPRRASESRAACGGDAFLRGVHVQQRRLGARRDANLCVGGGPQAS